MSENFDKNRFVACLEESKKSCSAESGSISKKNHAHKPRKFEQTVELQVSFRGIERTKETGFKAHALLDNPFRDDRFSVAVLATERDAVKAKQLGLPTLLKQDLDRLKGDKKGCKKLARQYDCFVASIAMVKSIPKLLRQFLSVRGKFPQTIAKSDELANKVEEMRRRVPIVLKVKPKCALNIGLPIGKANMDPLAVAANAEKVLTEVVGKCKKNWNNINGVVVKTTMGAPVRFI